MRIEMKTLYATPDRSIAAGTTANLPDDEAQELIDKGFAIPVDDETSPRRATAGKTKTSPPATHGDGDEVPDASVAKVTEWVGDDRDRAAQALKAEQERRGDRARASLVDHLTKMLHADPGDPGDPDGDEQQ
ncbi:DUF7302 family protein [Verrucosispora sp. TAA-831]|uniref:DUF7302 family protein n=1 Tax=Verrucosispora sp. TAA-831 TaxID=3422227 RepID=UPI003D6EE2CC